VGETKAVALSAAVGALTPTVFVMVCALLNLVRPYQVALRAGAVWLMAAVPMLICNYVFMKVHRTSPDQTLCDAVGQERDPPGPVASAEARCAMGEV
jgi:hypothetical protein